MENHTNYEMCKECGGVCCLTSGCSYLLEDFESMEFEYLKEKINKTEFLNIIEKHKKGVLVCKCQE